MLKNMKNVEAIPHFSIDKKPYLCTEEQIQNMADKTSISKDVLWSMFEKLS